MGNIRREGRLWFGKIYGKGEYDEKFCREYPGTSGRSSGDTDGDCCCRCIRTVCRCTGRGHHGAGGEDICGGSCSAVRCEPYPEQGKEKDCRTL